MNLHLEGCPYALYSRRYMLPTGEHEAPACTCPPEHKARYWKGQWMLLKARLKQIEQLSSGENDA